MSALNAGALPDTGMSYANQLLSYARDRSKDNDGHTKPVSGAHSVVMDMNTFSWVSRLSFRGVRYAASATLPFAWNGLVSDLEGPISGGRGFADSYYLPLILGRSAPRYDIRVQYGFLAPTGKYTATGSDNVGSGYWTHTVSSGQTLQLTSERRLALSIFEMYEVHTRQLGTAIHPGDTFNLDASLMVRLPTIGAAHVQAGAVGYSQRQLTSRTGPDITPEASANRYIVHALGGTLSAAFPARRASFGIKYFGEFANRSTFEGYSLQAFGAITL